MLKPNKSRVIIFHDKMGRFNEYIKEYDIFLTPKFYVVRREKLPIKFNFQAKKLAPSILDDLIDNKDGVSYVVYKENSEWVFIAYNLDLIYEYAKKAGLEPNSARDIYFAEQIRDNLDNPLCIGDDRALAVVEDYVALIPKNFIDKRCKEPDLSLIKSIKSYASAIKSSTLSTNQTYIISASFILIAILTFAEGFRYSKAAKKQIDKIVEVADGDTVLMSKITRKNILNKYKKIDKRERQIRETLKKIGSLLNSKVQLISFKSNQKGYSAILKSMDLATLNILQKRVSKKGFKYKKEGNKLIIEGKWK